MMMRDTAIYAVKGHPGIYAADFGDGDIALSCNQLTREFKMFIEPEATVQDFQDAMACLHRFGVAGFHMIELDDTLGVLTAYF